MRDTMSQVEDANEMGPTRPTEHHAFIEKFLGEWTVESQMMMGPDHSESSTGTESVSSFGGLFAHIEGEGTMPGGEKMHYRCAIGYDLTFEEIRGVWIADVSSHIWSYRGTLSEDGKKLTLECEGPNMDPTADPATAPKTAMYRDVHEFLSDDHRTLSSFGQQGDGTWCQFLTSHIRRVSSTNTNA
jgi:hypothetical protein